MMLSTLLPRPAIFTTHSPSTRSAQQGAPPPSLTSSMVIVPVTTARSVMLLTVWNVWVKGRTFLAPSAKVRVSTNSTSFPRRMGRTMRGSFMPGTVRMTTLTRPSTTSCESTSDSSVPSFSICGMRREGRGMEGTHAVSSRLGARRRSEGTT